MKRYSLKWLLFDQTGGGQASYQPGAKTPQPPGSLQPVTGHYTGPMPGDSNYPNYVPAPQPGSPTQQRLVGYGPGGTGGVASNPILQQQPPNNTIAPSFQTQPRSSGSLFNYNPAQNVRPVDNRYVSQPLPFGYGQNSFQNPYGGMQNQVYNASGQPLFGSQNVNQQQFGGLRQQAQPRPKKRSDLIFDALFNYLGQSR